MSRRLQCSGTRSIHRAAIVSRLSLHREHILHQNLQLVSTHRAFDTPIPTLLIHGTYTKNASITSRRSDAVHAKLWRASHEVEGGEEARWRSEYPTHCIKSMR
jgi:hypothetical protein